jgi:hypothetical protein
VRLRAWLVLAVLVIVAAGTAGCDRAGAAAAVRGCATLEPDTVTVSGASSFPEDGFKPVTVERHSLRLASSLLHDFCRTELQQEHPTGAISCPEEFGLQYRGQFLASGNQIAAFTWDASGCQVLYLTIHGRSTVNTWLVSAAAIAAPHIDTDFQHVLGVRCVDAIFEPPPVFGRGCRADG